MGVRACLSLLGYEILELGGVDADDNAGMVKKITDARRRGNVEIEASVETTVREGGSFSTCVQPKKVSRPVVFLDDLESFTPECRKLVSATLEQTNARGNSPVVITCTNLRDPSLKLFAKMKAISLKAPEAETIRCFLVELCSLTRGHVSTAMRLLPGCRDVRRIRLQAELESISVVQNERRGVYDFSIRNNFEASRRLLKGECTPETWTKHTEERDVDLLRWHLPNHVPNGMQDSVDRLASCLGDYSLSDSLSTERFENASDVKEYKLHVAALSTRINSLSRDVRALPPPPRVEAMSVTRTTREDDSGRRRERAFYLDAPTSMTDPWKRLQL